MGSKAISRHSWQAMLGEADRTMLGTIGRWTKYRRPMGTHGGAGNCCRRLIQAGMLACGAFLVGCGGTPPNSLTGPWDIVLLDAKTGESTGPTIRQRNYIVAFAVSANDETIVISCRKAMPDPQARRRRRQPSEEPDPKFTGILRVLDVESGKMLDELECPDTLHTQVWMSPTGKQFLTSTTDFPQRDGLAKPRFLMWDFQSGSIRPVARFDLAPRSNIAVAFTKDGQSVVMCGSMFDVDLDQESPSQLDVRNGRSIWAVRKWEAAGGNPVATRQVGLGVRSTEDVEQVIARVHLSADGSRLMTRSPSSNRRPLIDYQLWDVPTLEPIGERITLNTGQTPLFLNQDGTRVFTMTLTPREPKMATYQVLDAETGRPLGPPVEGLRSMQATFAGDGQSVLTLTSLGPDAWQLRLRDSAGTDTWSAGPYPTSRFLTGVTQRNRCIAFAVFPPDLQRTGE